MYPLAVVRRMSPRRLAAPLWRFNLPIQRAAVSQALFFYALQRIHDRPSGIWAGLERIITPSRPIKYRIVAVVMA